MTAFQSLTSVLVTWALAFSLLNPTCTCQPFLCVWVEDMPCASLRGYKQVRAWSISTVCQGGVLPYLILPSRFTDKET